MKNKSIVLCDVANALKEDLGDGDITALLLSEDKLVSAHIIARESMIVCGLAWVVQSFKCLDDAIEVKCIVSDGDSVKKDAVLCQIKGNARAILSAERVALNFLQLLSGVSTATAKYVELIKHTSVKLLDTRKTIPNLRYAQKYAVKCGGGNNHRMGLFDAFLIKENHIKACGSIEQAVAKAKLLAETKIVEVEVETIAEYKQALAAKPDVIMLDNFKLDDIKQAVKLRTDCSIKLEVSGGITADTIIVIAETGIDYISVGSITKSVEAIDLSLLLKE